MIIPNNIDKDHPKDLGEELIETHLAEQEKETQLIFLSSSLFVELK